MSLARQELLKILARQSFRLGDFKLSSGASSDYYIDCRTTTLDARGAQLTGEVFLEAIREQSWEPEAIGGLTMGADPVVVSVAVTSGKNSWLPGSQSREATRHWPAHRRLPKKKAQK